MNATEETFAAQPRVHTRVRHGLRSTHNWIQLFKFLCVGGTGYAVNLAVFALLAVALDVHHLVAATLAFIVAVSNNFWLNRHWTFGARDGHAGFQAARFFTVGVGAFLFPPAVPGPLVGPLGAPKVVAQAIRLIPPPPLHFLGD